MIPNDKNCGIGYPYQPMMMPQMMPYMSENASIEQRLQNIEKRLSIIESNLNGQNLNNNIMNNYQMI